MNKSNTRIDHVPDDAEKTGREEKPRTPERKLAAYGRNALRSEWRLFQLVAMTLAIAGAYFARDILVPIALAAFLSFVLAPVCTWLDRRGIPRALSVILAACMAASVILLIVGVAFFQFRQIGENFDTYKASLLARARTARAYVGGAGSINETVDEFGKALSKEEEDEESTDDPDGGAAISIEGAPEGETAANAGAASVGKPRKRERSSSFDFPFAASVVPLDTDGADDDEERAAVPVQIVGVRESTLDQLQSTMAPILAPFGTAGIVIVLAIFILLSRDNLRDRIVLLLGSSNLHSTTAAVSDVAGRVGRYLRMTLLINSGYACVIVVGCMLFGLPGAIVLGLLAGALRFVPYIGGWMAGATPLVLALAVHDGWGAPLGVAAMFAVCELFINTVLEPWLYGSSIGVTSVGIIVAAVFWTWLWGPIGLFLAMPLTVCLVVAGSYVPCLKFLTTLFGEEEPMPPHERLYQRLLGLDYEDAVKVASEYLSDKTLGETYDALILPALAAAERDQRSGVLNESQRASVFDGLDDLVAELAARSEAKGEERREAQGEASEEDREHACDVGGRPSPLENGRRFRTLIVPSEDRGDEVAADMLHVLLKSPCSDVERSKKRLLTVETVEQIEREDYDVVVISIVPPAGTRHARYLCRRLRAQRPAMPILVAVLSVDEMESTKSLLERDGASAVFFRASEAAEEFDKVMHRLSHVDREAVEKEAKERDPQSREQDGSSDGKRAADAKTAENIEA